LLIIEKLTSYVNVSLLGEYHVLQYKERNI